MLRILHFLEYVPIIGVFIACLKKYPSKHEDVEAILNVMGIVGALMLTLAASFATSVDYDELKAADERFLTSETKYTLHWKQQPVQATRGIWEPSARLCFYTMITVVLLTCEVLGVVLSYTSLLAIDRTDEGVQLHSWFRFARWSIFTVFGLLLAGLWTFFVTVCFLVQIKFPDMKVELTGSSDIAHPYGLVTLMSYMVLVVVLAMAVPLVLSHKRGAAAIVTPVNTGTDTHFLPVHGQEKTSSR